MSYYILSIILLCLNTHNYRNKSNEDKTWSAYTEEDLKNHEKLIAVLQYSFTVSNIIITTTLYRTCIKKFKHY